MRFLIDAQLPPGLARWIDSRGYIAVHVRDVGLANSEDSEIWSRALANGEIIVTRDEDFGERSARVPTCPTILWLRIGNSTNKALIAWIEPRWNDICLLLELDQTLIEVI